MLCGSIWPMPEFPDAHRDLLDAPVAILSTNGRDGYPQVTAVTDLRRPR